MWSVKMDGISKPNAIAQTTVIKTPKCFFMGFFLYFFHKGDSN